MDITILQDIIIFLDINRITNTTNYNIDKKLLNDFAIDNTLDINTYKFLFDNIINKDVNCDMNKNFITKSKINPTGVTANFLILLYCIWQNPYYLELLKNTCFMYKMRIEFTKHIKQLLFLQISGDLWIKFKNCIFIDMYNTLDKTDFDNIYDTLTTNTKQYTYEYDNTQIKHTGENKRLDKVKNKMTEIEKRLC